MSNLGSVNFDSQLFHAELSPKNAAYFKKRICIRFVKDPKTNKCAGCKRITHNFPDFREQIENITKWNSETCTITAPTDSFGRLKFPGSRTKIAEYIRVEQKTLPEDMIQYMYNPTGWNMSEPQLILSVTGGAQKFTVPYRMKKAFKQGLVKAAATTGAWIITGGTSVGVMNMVGEAIAEESPKYSSRINCIGIATWGVIALREKMVKNKNNDDRMISNSMLHDQRFLTKQHQTKIVDYTDKRLFSTSIKKEAASVQNPTLGSEKKTDKAKETSSSSGSLLEKNHTHFILVDDGSEGAFGKEIEFRARLEAELRKGKSRADLNKQSRERSDAINKTTRKHAATTSVAALAPSPMIIESLNDNNKSLVPMVLIVVNGGPNTLFTVKEALEQSVPVLVLAESKGCADLIANACLLSNPNEATLVEIIEESKMFERKKGTPDYKKDLAVAVGRCKFIVEKYKEDLINIFTLDSEDGNQDIELAILRAFLNSRRKEHYENLKLALKWNRYDIAKSDIFTGEEEFTPLEKIKLMEMALMLDRPQFVELLLENGLDLPDFVNRRRLVYLYNAKKLRNLEIKAPIYKMYKKKFWVNNEDSTITFKGLRRFLRTVFFEDFDPQFLPEDLNDWEATKMYLVEADKKETSICEDPIDMYGMDDIMYPEKNLFVWALLMNRMEMAQIFWKIGNFQVTTALFAYKLVSAMSDENKIPELKNKMAKVAEDFEQKACNVMNLIDTQSDDWVQGVILLQRIPYYNLECMTLAEKTNCLNFIALSSVQDLLTDIWNRSGIKVDGLRNSVAFVASCLSLGILAPFVLNIKKKKQTTTNSVDPDFDMDYVIANVGKFENFLMNEEKIMEASGSLVGQLCSLWRDKNSKKQHNGDEDDDEDDVDDDTDYTDNKNMDADDTHKNENEYFNKSDQEASKNLLDHNDNNSPRVVTLDNTYSVEQQKALCINMEQQGIAEIDANAEPDVRKHYARTFFRLYFRRYHRFINSPRVHFVYDAIFFIMFLALFSYMLLCDFNYYEPLQTTSPVNKGNLAALLELNVTNGSFQRAAEVANVLPNGSKVRKVASPSAIEYVMIFWIFSFFIEELFQFVFAEENFKLAKQIKSYFDNKWNYLDVSGIIVFGIALSLRFISIWTDEAVFVAARLLFALDLSIWYVRLLHVSIVFKSLGPKLVMIQKMMFDLVFFIIIIAIFVCSFGVTTQATLYPGNKFGMKLIKDLINKGYWPIYGDMKILGEIEDREAACLADSSQTCPETTGTIFSYIALMIYMIIANVLLVNLLIAMFSSTFQNVQDNTDQIWMSQRYRLVFEYYDSSVFPPPVNFIGYIGELVVNIYRKISQKKQHESEKISLKQSQEADIDLKPEYMLLMVERKFAEEHLRKEQQELIEKTDSRLKSNVEKLDSLEQKLNKVINSKNVDQTKIDKQKAI